MQRSMSTFFVVLPFWCLCVLGKRITSTTSRGSSLELDEESPGTAKHSSSVRFVWPADAINDSVSLEHLNILNQSKENQTLEHATTWNYSAIFNRSQPSSLAQKSLTLVHNRLSEDRFTGMNLILILGAIIGVILLLCGMKKAQRAIQKFDIRNFCGLDEVLLNMGYDKYASFVLTMVVAKTFYGKAKAAIRITAGVNSVITNSPDQKSQIRQTLTVIVPQGTRDVRMEIIDPKQTVMAFKKLGIEDVVRLAESSEEQTISLQLKNKKFDIDPRVTVTFYAELNEDDDADDLIEGVDSKKLSPEMHMLLAKSNSERVVKKASLTGAELQASQEATDDPLDIIAGTCRGKLKVGGFFNSSTMYFAVFQCGKDGVPKKLPPDSKAAMLAWSLGWWKEEAGFTRKDPPKNRITMLRTTNIHAVPDKPDDFCLRYLDKSKQKQELYLTRTGEKSRDVWVESLHLFLEQLHSAHSNVRQKKRGSSESIVSEVDSDSNAGDKA